MFELYYTPGTCSLAVHIALIQASLPHRLHLVRLQEGEQLRAGYEQIHPLRRVPALRLENGRMLTEVTAILFYLASQSKAPHLLPTNEEERSLALEWMGLLSAAVHPSFWGFIRPDRYCSDEATQAMIKKETPERFFSMLQHVEARLNAGSADFVQKYDFLAAYSFVFYLWAVRLKLPTTELSMYTRLVRRLIETAPVQHALTNEGASEMLERLTTLR